MSDEDIFGDNQSLEKSLDSNAESKQVNDDENDEGKQVMYFFSFLYVQFTTSFVFRYEEC